MSFCLSSIPHFILIAVLCSLMCEQIRKEGFLKYYLNANKSKKNMGIFLGGGFNFNKFVIC